MKFYNYLNEKKPYEQYEDQEIIDVLQSECSDYIKEGKLLYRGYRSPDIFFAKKPRKNRTPLDMPITIHNALDKYFNKKFGWKPRSEGVFCMTTSDYASSYGRVYGFFPVNGYEHIYNPNIFDLFEIYDKSLNDYIKIAKPEYANLKDRISFIKDLKNGKDKAFVKEHLNKFIDRYLDGYTNDKIKNNYIGEVMVKCDKYYMLLVTPSKSHIFDKLGLVLI